MGSLISVWSPFPRTGKTVFTYILANHLNTLLDKQLKILVCCGDMESGSLMDLFGIDKEALNIEDLVNAGYIQKNGSMALEKLLASRDRLYFAGSRKSTPSYVTRQIEGYRYLIDNLTKQFDLTLADTGWGDRNPLTSIFLEKHTCMLNLFPQDKQALDRVLRFTHHDFIGIAGMYRNVYPDKKDLSSLYGINQLFALPVCDTLLEMKNRDKLELYLQHETEYNNTARDIAHNLAERYELAIENEVYAERKQKTILQMILGGSK